MRWAGDPLFVSRCILVIVDRQRYRPIGLRIRCLSSWCRRWDMLVQVETVNAEEDFLAGGLDKSWHTTFVIKVRYLVVTRISRTLL